MSPSSFRRAVACTALAGLVLTGCRDERTLAGPPGGLTLQAAVGDAFTVTNTNDAGPGSLRQTIADAGTGGTIQFDAGLAGQTIALESTLELENTTLIIEGPQSGGITLDGGGQVRVLHVKLGAASGATDVTLRNVTISGGKASIGGGILNTGTLRLENSTVTNNEAHAVAATGGVGGGVATAGNLVVVNSTISGNSAESGGGGIYHEVWSLTLINATIAFNSGTGLFIVASTDVTIRNSILASNTSGSTIENCLISSSTVTYAGQNISSDASCGAGTGITVSDPALDPLADNGGPTHTHALVQASPAIDAATACNVTIDQRYVARPQGAACDVGAYEFDDYTIIALVVDGSVNVNPTTGVAVLSGSITCTTAESFDLNLELAQNQKARRAPAVVHASVTIPVTCDPARGYWSAAMAPSSGSFQNGSATAGVASANTSVWVTPITMSRAVKLFWGHK